MSWLSNLVSSLVPDPSSRRPLTFESFYTYIAPAALAYYVAAILVILPGTRPIRLGVLPLKLWLFFRAGTSVNVVETCGDPGYKFLDYFLGLAAIILGMRIVDWAFVQKPLMRFQISDINAIQNDKDAKDAVNGFAYGRAQEESSPSEQSPTLLEASWDAFDICNNLRGQGWNWGRNCYFPPETRTTSSTRAFLASTLVSTVIHLLLFDVMLSSVRSISPSTFGSPVGGTIYDASLPFSHRYAQATFITLAGGITIYSIVQLVYDITTIVCISILQQHPRQWPPIFDSPWLSTSLAVLWGRRWHQSLRGVFIGVGARPLSFLIGRIGGVMGAFFWSAILHDFGLWGIEHGTEFWSVGGFFLVMGVGCILEAVFTKATGLKVGGWAGWLWTMGWLVGWGQLLVDAYARRGLVGSKFVPDGYMPSQILFSYISA